MPRIDVLFSRNYLFYFLLVLSTAFFVYQHSTGLSWDFSTYVLNARYLFSDGIYFEWARPPLAPFIMGVFSVFGWAEYAYIIFVSALFAYSSVRLAGYLGVDKTLYYMLILTPFTLNFGFSIGTELLALSLLQLSLSCMHSGKFGVFVSLLSLAHYSKIVYAVLAFFKRDARKILAAFAIMVLVFLPWLLYTYMATGDALTGIADQYALSVKFRDYMKIPVNVDDIVAVGGYYLLLLPVGIYTARRKLFEEKNAAVLAVLFISVLSYALIPHKEARYMFTLALPLAYFAYLAVRRLKFWKEAVLAMAAANVILSILTFVPLESAGRFTSVDADNCMLASNAWVYLDYLGKNAEPYPRKSLVLEEIGNGKRIVLFKGLPEPDYLYDKAFMDSLPKLAENDNYVMLGNATKCAPLKKTNVTYLEQLGKGGINISACEVLLPAAICDVFA